MTYAPVTLQNLRSYLVAQGAPVLGIVGDVRHVGGYHHGKDRIYDEDANPPGRGDDDYSVKTSRDRAGLTDAAAAIDIGHDVDFRRDELSALLTHLITEAKAGRAPDIREVIYESYAGRVLRRWDDVTGKTTYNGNLADLHHGHVSYFRDSQSRTKLPPYQAFFQPAGDEMVYSIKGVDGPFPATVMAGTPYYSSPEDQTPTGTINTPDRPFTVICESKDGQRRCIYGRTSPTAERAVLGWVDSARIVR